MSPLVQGIIIGATTGIVNGLTITLLTQAIIKSENQKEEEREGY